MNSWSVLLFCRAFVLLNNFFISFLFIIFKLCQNCYFMLILCKSSMKTDKVNLKKAWHFIKKIIVHLLCLQLKLMSTVLQTQPTIQLLLSAPDYVAALDLIFTTQELLSRHLAGVHSFRCVVFGCVLQKQVNHIKNIFIIITNIT